MSWIRTEIGTAAGRLNIWLAGEGPPVIALHGLGGSGRYWQGLAGLLDGRFTLIAPDLAGFGRSEKPRRRYDRGLHLSSLETLVSWGGGKPVMIGHSLGGVLAALWASTHPDRTAALGVISAPYPRPSLMTATALRIARADPEDRARLVGGMFRTVFPAVGVAARLSRRFPPGLVGDYGRQSIGARADTMWSVLGDLTVIDDLAPLATTSPSWPNLLMATDDDQYLIPGDIDRWHQLLPNAESVIVPAGGHQFLIRSGFEPLAAWIKRL